MGEWKRYALPDSPSLWRRPQIWQLELEKGEKGLERRGGGEPKNQNLQNLAENVFSNRIVRKESVNQLPAMLRKRVNLNICVTRPE